MTDSPSNRSTKLPRIPGQRPEVVRANGRIRDGKRRHGADALGLAGTHDWGDSTAWQNWVIDLVKAHEEENGYDHRPIGMTMQFPVADQTTVNDPLFASRADWISPGYDDEIFADGGHPMAPGSPQSHWLEDPPAAHGCKVMMTDTDHYAPGRCDALWAWKSFLRGHHPILMDFGIIGGVDAPDPAFSPARFAMGDTRRFADRMNVLHMTPRGELTSTGYALANPGDEYLVLQPAEDRAPFTVDLEAVPTPRSGSASIAAKRSGNRPPRSSAPPSSASRRRRLRLAQRFCIWCVERPITVQAEAARPPGRNRFSDATPECK